MSLALTHELKELMEQGHVFIKQKKINQALLYFNRILLLAPNNVEALINCTKMLIELNRPAEAALYSQRALELDPKQYILSLHGKVLYLLGEYTKALDCFEHLIAAEPDNYIAIGQRALCLTQVNRHQEALETYQKALLLCDYKDDWIHYNYSLCVLAMGNLSLGFKLFEYRWLCPLKNSNKIWVLPQSMSREVLQGKSILIYSEQGLGDSIQFFRYIPLLVHLGARVFLEIQPGLIPLFNSWHDTIHFIAKGSSLPHSDYHCPLMSLARLFNTELHTIPKAIPYISPDLVSFEACQKKLEHSNHKKIGIAWRGSDLNALNSQRSITLTDLLTIHQPNLDFICLQKEVSLEEKQQLDHYKIPYHSLELYTMIGTAALIACLDLVITIDTSIAHLAAAMGKEVWILLPFSADWRWFLKSEESPWYPRVKLFRQTALKEWNRPLSQIKNALLTIQNRTPEPSLADLITKANLQFQNRDFLQAEQLYQKILVRNPTNHQAMLGIALIAFEHNNLVNALQWMHQAVDIAPHVALYRRNLGELLRRMGQHEAAINVLHKAIRIEPHSAENHFLLGLTYNNSGQFDLSIQHYRTALSYDQNYGLAWNNLGATLEKIGDKQQAKIAYRTAIDLNPQHAEAQNNLAAIYSEEGQLKEAKTHFEAAIVANPNFIDAHYNLSLIKTYTEDDPHLTFIKNLDANSMSISSRIHYYFTLGKALDDIKQYQDAFKAYAEGNRLHYLYKPWDHTKLHHLIEQMPSLFPKSSFKKSLKIKETNCPIFIVGMPRSGTTLIEQILASHEQIYGAGELSTLDEVIKEACHTAQMPFNTWVRQLSNEDYANLGQQYLQRTSQLADGKKYIIDKMPSNCFYVGMIYRMLPSAKIIHAIRDPMDSCFSCFTHLFKESMDFSYDLNALGDYYILYARAMQHWHWVLPQKAIFDLPYEQMVEQTESLSKQLIEYIGLDWDPNCLNFYKNDRLVKTASLTQVRQPIYKSSVQRWQHFIDELQPLLQILAPYRQPSNKYGQKWVLE